MSVVITYTVLILYLSLCIVLNIYKENIVFSHICNCVLKVTSCSDLIICIWSTTSACMVSSVFIITCLQKKEKMRVFLFKFHLQNPHKAKHKRKTVCAFLLLLFYFIYQRHSSEIVVCGLYEMHLFTAVNDFSLDAHR